MNFPFLTAITFLPVLGMIIISVLPKDNVKLLRILTATITGMQVILAVVIWHYFDIAKAGINDASSFQFVEKLSWIRLNGGPVFGSIEIDYFMGIDGLSVTMVLLTAIVSFIATFASFSITKSHKGYFMLFLLLDTGMMGAFVALDFFLFYVFWELMLLPMYFLIGVWGGPRREYAAIKFFIYTLFGSVFMLLVIIALYFSFHNPQSGAYTFNMLTMMDPKNAIDGAILSGTHHWWRYAAYAAMFLGFAIKVPMFPFHTWLPDAHVEAPTAISVILAGVLLKLGTYGILRICYGIFPDGAVYFAEALAIFGFINIVYGALVAMAQKDLKKLIAYSSVSHMGYVLLGMSALNTMGIQGAVFQMFNHGIITSMLFLLVGVLYDRAHTRGIDEFGGLMNKMPKYSAIVVIAFFAAIGLPGMSGFVSEAFVFLGAFAKFQFWTTLSTLGIVLGAGYMLWTLQRMFFGTLPERWTGLTEINGRELFTLVPLVVIVIFLGCYPSPFLNMMNSSVNHLVLFVNEMGKMPVAAALIK